MNQEDTVLSKISLSQKDKYCMIPLTWGILKTQALRKREQNGSCQGLRRGQWGVMRVGSFSYTR